MATLTLQPDSATGYDTYVDMQSPDSNTSSESILLFGTVGGNKLSDNGFEMHSLLRFDLTAIQPGSTINSASLTLYNDGLSNSGGHLGYNIAREARLGWTKSGATWNKYDGTHTWNLGGGQFAVDAFPDSSITLSADTDDLVFNAATLVADAIANRNGRLDVIVGGNGNDGDGNDAYIEVHSSRSGTAAKRPKLVVNYTAPAGKVLIRRGLAGGMRDLTGI